MSTYADHDEIDRYRQAVEEFLAGTMDGDRFMAFRLQHGIYGQRQDGVHMIRIKLPGGRLAASQLRAVATAVERHAGDPHAAVTTRQDIQLHYVPLAQTADVMSLLADVGLTTREACGNTVRNITACTLAGACPREHTDAQVPVEAITRHFLRHPLTQHLPRKFKISASGCEHDCAMSMMHDVGIVATRRDGQPGYKVLAGGGLGHKPHEAIEVEPFVSEAQLLPTIEALIALHNRYSDRKRRAKARIKFLVDKFGPEGFRAKYREELTRTLSAHANPASAVSTVWRTPIPGPAPGAGAPRHVTAQHQPDRYALPISLPLGEITAPQLHALADTMDAENLAEVRATPDQNLVLLHVPGARLDAVRQRLHAADLHEPAAGDDIVSCPGTTTCRLGITSSKLLAGKLSGPRPDLRIRVSGCHNSCGQHHVGDIGLHGEAQRVHGRLIPCYVLHLGGHGGAGGRIGAEGPAIPSMRAPQAITRITDAFERERADHATSASFAAWTQAKGMDYFNELLRDLTTVAADDLIAMAKDHGDEQPFAVVPMGGGECAGASQDFVAARFAEAWHERGYRNAFLSQRKHAAALDCAEHMLGLIATAAAYFRRLGQAASLDVLCMEWEQAVDATRIASPQPLRDQIAVQRQDADEHALSTLFETIDLWLKQAADYCQEQDAQLNLVASLPELQTAGRRAATEQAAAPNAPVPPHAAAAPLAARSPDLPSPDEKTRPETRHRQAV